MAKRNFLIITLLVSVFASFTIYAETDSETMQATKLKLEQDLEAIKQDKIVIQNDLDKLKTAKQELQKDRKKMIENMRKLKLDHTTIKREKDKDILEKKKAISEVSK